MKVAYFDYWTAGLHHFVGIDAALKARGVETLFLHIGSLRSIWTNLLKGTGRNWYPNVIGASTDSRSLGV